jgi:anti-anti-sigma factor
MPPPQGTVRAHQQDQRLIFQVDGWTTMNQSLSFRRCAEQGLASGVTTLWVDLRRCTFMDSTFIGTLLFLKREAHRRPNGEFALVSPSEQCCKLFKQMGLEGVFPIITAEDFPPDAGTELTGGKDDLSAFKRNVVQAHQELASLEGPAGEPFRAVVRCLAKDLEAEKTRNP